MRGFALGGVAIMADAARFVADGFVPMAAFALGDASPRTLCSTRKDGQCTVCYTPRITIVEVLSGWKR